MRLRPQEPDKQSVAHAGRFRPERVTLLRVIEEMAGLGNKGGPGAARCYASA